MQNNLPDALELVYVIVHHGMGKQIEKMARQNAARYTSCMYGIGSASRGILDMMGLSDVRKEIVNIVMDGKDVEVFLQKMDEKFKFSKPNHGIAFTIPLTHVIACQQKKVLENNWEEMNMNDLITVIVDRGKAEDVIEYALKAGAKGGTIVNARGSAGEEYCQKVFAMEIEPEKEIVIIISETDKTEKISDSIYENMKLGEPNSGILYVQPVKRTLGIQK